MRRWVPLVLAFVAGGVSAVLFQIALKFGHRSGEVRKVNLSVEEFRPEGGARPGIGVPQATDAGVYRVKRVVDGDTIVLDNGLHVRYQGMNAPESGRFIRDPAPIATAATERNKQLVDGQEVRLSLARDPVDAYGRVVAHVYARRGAGEWEDVELTLVREGLARFMAIGLSPEDFESLKSAEAQAKAAHVGLWGVVHPLAGTAPPAHLFCAASRSEVYHRVECYQAKRISAANFQGYKTLAEVQATGRRPCPRCLKDLAPVTNAPPEPPEDDE